MMTRSNKRLATIVAAVWAIGFAVSGTAFADNKAHCEGAQENMKPTSEVEQQLTGMGYQVHKIKAHGSCYEVKASKDGQKLKLVYDGGSSEMLRAKLSH